MGHLFKRIPLRKPDEMERAILFRAQRNAYLFLVFALVLWSLYESYRVYTFHTLLNPLPSLLLCGAAMIQLFTQLILQRRAVMGDEDSYETAPLLRIVLWVCVLLAGIATVAAAVVWMVVGL